MSIYEYIASNDPAGARRLIQQFGYTIRDNKNMANNLRVLVNNEGEPALKALMDMHPEKGVILDFFSKPEKEEHKCACGSCSAKKEPYLGADGLLTLAMLNTNKQEPTKTESNDSNKLAQQNNGLIIAAAILFAVVLFKMK